MVMNSDTKFYRGLFIGGILSMALWAAALTLFTMYLAPPCSGHSTIDGRSLCQGRK
jgi:uncharacterized BrkB/YihY/UPF0761 family membrane protein